MDWIALASPIKLVNKHYLYICLPRAKAKLKLCSVERTKGRGVGQNYIYTEQPPFFPFLQANPKALDGRGENKGHIKLSLPPKTKSPFLNVFQIAS